MSYTTVQNPGTPRQAWDTFATQYGGSMSWTSDGSFPAMNIELFIKDHPIPMRKPKFSEINTIRQKTTQGNLETGFGGIFQGASDPLQVAISGWLITPTSSNQWTPLNSVGTVTTAFGNRSYPEIISGFLSGELTTSRVRRDPDQYVAPLGQVWNSPLIYTWDWGLSTNMRKQTFSAVLYLEH